MRPKLGETQTFSCEAHLDSGAIILVEYESQYIKPGLYTNTITKCIYQNVDVTPCFMFRGLLNEPIGVYEAVENNSIFQWQKITHPQTV